MITAHYSSTGDRPLEEIKGLKIIDIGGANSFADGYLDAIVEIRQPLSAAKHKFIGDINMPEIWEELLNHVKTHGKWEYAITTHTLEDIANPLLVCRMMEKIADRGLIIVPSKYRELARFSGPYRGFIHHRWVFDVLDGVLTGFPKTNYIEHPVFDDIHKGLPGREELIVEWEGNIDMRVVNDDMPFAGEHLMLEGYSQLRDRKTKVITTSSDRAKTYRLEQSLKHFGWDYEIILHKWDGFLGKLHETYKYLKTIEHEYTHFLYSDAFDSLVMREPINLSTIGLIFSAEKACYPHGEKEPLYPAHPSPWRYVNGGGWGGEISAFIKMYEANPPTNELNDQVYLTDEFLKSLTAPVVPIRLDYTCEIFQTIGFSEKGDFTVVDGKLTNPVHGTTPFFWHGNGHVDMQWAYDYFDSLDKINL